MNKSRVSGRSEVIMTELKTDVKISMAQAPELDARLKELLETDEDTININMEDTTYISSVGLRALASAQKKANQTGKELLFTGVRPQILEIFEVTGFAGVFNIM